MAYVIGSGPAGVSCATALLEQGLSVTMLDAGFELESDRALTVDAMRRLEPARWRGPASALLRVSPDNHPMGLSRKLAYGSDFPYRGVEALANVHRHGTEATLSLAKGGFSNVWGAAILPYTAADIDGWPISLEELAPHYRGVLQYLDISAAADDLAAMFPLYTDNPHPLRQSRQATAFLADLNRHKTQLNSAGIQFGASRLAVRAQAQGDLAGCVYCGLCMYGCPNKAIYNSADYVDGLRRHPGFQYIPDILVTRLDESSGRVVIEAKNRRDGARVQFNAERVYLACGPISSTQILLESLEAFDVSVTMLDSSYFLLPLARIAATPDVRQESLHTLAQAFLEITDPDISRHFVHAQVYSYNDLYPAALKEAMGLLSPLLGLARDHLLGRLLITQCYLHSELSPLLAITLSRTRGKEGRDLLIQADRSGEKTRTAVDQVVKKLRGHWRALRAIPLRAGLRMGTAGRGFHSGGTFPMVRSPGKFQSDILGRPTGFSRVHVVDSTVFPSIPATTITLSVMANARRIASRHGEL